MELSARERRDRLRLIRTSGIGPITFFELLSRFGGQASEAISALPELSMRAGRYKRLHAISVAQADREIEETESYGAVLVHMGEPDFPPALSRLEPGPPVVTILGKLDLFKRPCMAMVGTRNASAVGLSIAADMASDLGQAGYVVVSGLARGIDGCSHKASLETGTIGVLAGGIDHVYPQEHEDLYGRLSERGALLSESSFGYRAVSHDFPRRNRLITGLSRGVVVVEATRNSGSLVSARLALEQHREVMVVPGSPLESRSAGSNELIRSGAHLVESAEHVLEVCPLSPEDVQDSDGRVDFELEAVVFEVSGDLRERVYGLIGVVPVHVDRVAQAADITSRQAGAVLADLELSGRVVTMSGGLVCRFSGHHLAERS